MTSALNHRYPSIQGEFENELEFENEDELEFEDEFEAEDELEFEDEAFLGTLGGIARGVGGLLGGSTEFENENENEEEAEFEFEFEAEAEAEWEDEGEFENEEEAFVNPIKRIYRDAELMAHLSRQAAAAENEDESEAFIGALVPLAARLIPRAASLVVRNAPALIRGATTIARNLRRDPATRRLIEAMPVVLQRTAQSLADQAANGRLIDGGTVVQTIARTAGRVFRTPARRRSAVRAVKVFDQRYRQRARRAAQARRRSAATAGGPAYRQPRQQPRRQPHRGAGNRAARRARRTR
jgi:hypothetical protein